MIWKIKCPHCGNDICVNGAHLYVYHGYFLDAKKYPYRAQCLEECDECGVTFALNIDITVLSVSVGLTVENKKLG